MKYEVEVVLTVEAVDDMNAWDLVEAWLEHNFHGAPSALTEFEMVGVKDTPPPDPDPAAVRAMFKGFGWGVTE